MKNISSKSKIWIGLLISIALLLAAGCSNKTPNAKESNPKKVNVIFSFKTGELDAHTDFTPVRAGITETLVKLDENGEITSWLAESWSTADNVTWKFIIRENITFHDGTVLDAAGVKASIERSIKTNTSLANSLHIHSMTAEKQTLTIETKEPYPALLSELVNPYTSIVQTKAESKMGEKAFKQAPIGTGPFQVTAFTPNEQLHVSQYSQYWAGKPKLNEAVIQFNEDVNVRTLALQSKEADIVYNLSAEGIEAIETDEEIDVQAIAGLRAHFFVYNQQREHVQDVKVRQALDLLVNRKSIAEDLLLGQAKPANGPFNPVLSFGLESSVADLNVQKAKVLLQQAGYKQNADGKMEKNGQELALNIITYQGRPELPLIAQLFQSDAAKAGVTVHIQTVENIDTYLAENQNWDIATYSNNTAPRGDGSYFLTAAFTKTGALNFGSVAFPPLTKVIQQLNATIDPAKRIVLTKEAGKIITEQVFHSYAVYPDMLVGVNKRITGWKPTQEEYYVLTHKMDVN